MTKRNERRTEFNKNVTATVLGNPDVTMPCDIVNLSQSGLCIAIDQEVERGTAVKIDWDHNFLLGRVRHVSTGGIDFRVGLELLYCSKWSGLTEAEFGLEEVR